MANPFPIAFEEGLPSFEIPSAAEATVFELPGGGPFPASPVPVNSIRSDQPWGLRVAWTTQGALSPLLAGTWEVTVYLDRLGSGPFSVPGNVQTTALLATNPAGYTVDFGFAAGLVPAGAYRMAVTVTMRGPAPGLVPGPIGGIGDGPLLQFYNA